MPNQVCSDAIFCEVVVDETHCLGGGDPVLKQIIQNYCPKMCDPTCVSSSSVSLSHTSSVTSTTTSTTTSIDCSGSLLGTVVFEHLDYHRLSFAELSTLSEAVKEFSNMILSIPMHQSLTIRCTEEYAGSVNIKLIASPIGDGSTMSMAEEMYQAAFSIFAFVQSGYFFVIPWEDQRLLFASRFIIGPNISFPSSTPPTAESTSSPAIIHTGKVKSL